MAMALHQQSSFEMAACHCCRSCSSYLKLRNENSIKSSSCWLCLGLWQDKDENDKADNNQDVSTVSNLRRALETCCESYGGISSNRFSSQTNQSHTVSLSGDLSLRYRWLASFSPSSVPFSNYLQDLKQHIHARIEAIIEGGNNTEGYLEEKNQQWLKDHRRVFEEEEQGSLSIHLLCLPPKDHPMNSALLRFMNNHQSHKSKKKRNRYNKRQKCGPFTTQGGDPRQNLEVRLRSQGYEWISQSTAEELSSMPVPPGMPSYKATMVPDDTQSYRDSSMMAEYHVAVFRRPMFLYGYYTKSRRDVSQSPFVVMREKPSPSEKGENGRNVSDNKHNTKEAETLGATSVEEQICGPIQELLGISTQNNLLPNASSNSGGGVLYGMIKFHASGREDMDVRMLVRSGSPTCHGRPFCVQIIDALKPISSPKQLQGLIETINHSTKGTLGTTEITNSKTDLENGANNLEATFYGQNPMGVGISPDAFRPVSATVFSGLQKDTESKTKHYGCFCWSNDVIPDGDDLTKVIFGDLDFPLTIKQRTPFRVLHRRANSIRERNILNAKATKIDDHHFRLELSTQAGTYVKEFVYGDFGRTIPSVSSLLGCKATLLKLDCEGIEIPAEQSI